MSGQRLTRRLPLLHFTMYSFWSHTVASPEGTAMTTDSIRGSSDRSILLLTSLADCPKHGYALIKDIEEFAGVKLGAGTLYSALGKLERAGLVAALPAAERRHPS